MRGRPRYWDELIGSGPPPVKTRDGWLHVSIPVHGGAGWRRRVKGTLIGVLVIVATHLLLSGLTFHLRGGLASFPLYVAVVCDAVPLLLWAVLCRGFVAAVIGSCRLRETEAG